MAHTAQTTRVRISETLTPGCRFTCTRGWFPTCRPTATPGWIAARRRAGRKVISGPGTGL